ncbi:MAG: arginase family protein [Bacteroidia bacterium]|nr:arginase family protein [Bacteroidia bacterium]
MDNLKLFNKTTLNSLLNLRSGESKFGEHVQILTNVFNIYEQLKNLDVKYVIFGIPEDIGVFANHGKSGAYKGWEATINILLNTQTNCFNDANQALILGHLDFTNEMETCSKLDQSKKSDRKAARNLVSKIDIHVTDLVYQIVKAGKIPIIIGGGQNNAYGNIKGTSLVKNSAINVVNLDAHADFRREEGRHSGNGFSYAFAEGFLKNYFVFGLHENYTSETIFKTVKKIKSVQYNTFEGLKVRKETKFRAELQRALDHVSNNSFGIEIDCDAIENIPSSAQTPSGFSVNNAREFVNFFGQNKNASYLHISEASPKKKQVDQVGKFISFLITDFMRANAS